MLQACALECGAPAVIEVAQLAGKRISFRLQIVALDVTTERAALHSVDEHESDYQAAQQHRRCGQPVSGHRPAFALSSARALRRSRVREEGESKRGRSRRGPSA